MRRVQTLLLALSFSLPALAPAESLKLPLSADVGICAHPKEVLLNTGSRSVIRIKGNEHFYLFNFGVDRLQGKPVRSATLHLKLRKGNIRKLAVSTVATPWSEGTARSKPQKGSSCFTHARYPSKAWTSWGGNFLSATFNSPHMAWANCPVRQQKGWLLVDIPPRFIEAVAGGLSHGLAIREETGQTFENHDISTREQSGSAPFLTLAIGGRKAVETVDPPEGIHAGPDVSRADFTHGAIRASLPPLDANKPDLHQPVLWTLTQPGSQKALQEKVSFTRAPVDFEGLTPQGEYVVRARGMGSRGTWQYSRQVRASKELAIPGVPTDSGRNQSAGLSAADWSARWLAPWQKADLASRPAREAGQIPVPVRPRGSWLSMQAVIHPPEGKAEDVRVTVDIDRSDGSKGSPIIMKLYRLAAVKTRRGWQGEVLVPLDPRARIDMPWTRNTPAKATCEVLLVDAWIPPNCKPGRGKLMLTCRPDKGKGVSIPLEFEIHPFALPDRFRIAGDMNTYGSPARAMGLGNSQADAMIAMNQKYHRLAHAHRMTLNPLPYTQAGQPGWRGAPELKGSGASLRVGDWSKWDQRFGPLLSGEAFSAESGFVGPGQGVPVRHMYLPLHENWPVKLAGHFKPWPPPKDYRQFLRWSAELPPIEKSLPEGYAKGWVAVLEDFADHLAAKEWTDTRYQVYLNNKYYFRDTSRHSGRGVSLWLLDEPMFAADFQALAYFGRLTRQVAGDVDANEGIAIDYRIDISRPAQQRDFLDGVVDLNVCANQLHAQRRWIAYRRERFGEQYWNYRMPESFGKSNLGWALWPVRSYCWGATGTLPWQTIGSDGDLLKADATALMYPGRKFGLDRPIPSLRMKAWREGLELSELLLAVREDRSWNDLQLRSLVGQVCKLKGWKDGWDPPADAEITTFAGLDAADLARLRRVCLSILAHDSSDRPE